MVQLFKITHQWLLDNSVNILFFFNLCPLCCSESTPVFALLQKETAKMHVIKMDHYLHKLEEIQWCKVLDANSWSEEIPYCYYVICFKKSFFILMFSVVCDKGSEVCAWTLEREEREEVGYRKHNISERWLVLPTLWKIFWNLRSLL